MSDGTPQIPRPRMQGLSDLIFGLALSIGAIQLVGTLPATSSDLAGALVAFGFSFLILINVWNRYTTTMSVMPFETSGLIRLNMLLLFLVAVEPFLFDVLFAKGLSTDVGAAASVYYGLDIGAMNLVLAYFTHILASEEKALIPKELIRKYKVIRDLLFLGGAIFLVSALPIFLAISVAGEPLRVIFWFITIPVVWTHRFVDSRASKQMVLGPP